MQLALPVLVLHTMASLVHLLCLLLNILNSGTFCNFQPKQVKERKALFIFGDSLFDPGNNVYLNQSSREASTYWPYGETFFRHPNGRYTDGRIVPDFIATFADLPLIPPYLKPGRHKFTDGANFAFAGARVLDLKRKNIIDLPQQLECFKDVVKLLKQEQGDIQAQRVLNNAVYLFSIGGVDYCRIAGENHNITESSQKIFVEMVIGNLTNVVKELYSLGGRKIAIQNAGPLGCTPFSRIDEKNCDEVLMSMARLHNRALSGALKELKRELSGFRYSIFDYYHAALDRTENPSKYGFKVGSEACCGSGTCRGENCGEKYGHTFQLCSNPFEYMWFDGLHTGEGANRQLAELQWSGPPNFTRPYTVQQLFDISS